MISLFLYSRPLAKLNREQFQHSLLHDHAPLVRSCSGYVKPTKGYMQNHFSMQLSLSGGTVLLREPRFDNCSEFWYDRVDQILAAYNNEDYFRMLRPDEDARTDKSTRLALIGEETVTFEAPEFKASPLMPKVVVLSGRGMASANFPDVNLNVRCVRKTVNRILGEFDFFNTKIAEGVTPEFTTITTYTLSERIREDGSMPDTGTSFNIFESYNGTDQIALWSRSHQIIGDCA